MNSAHSIVNDNVPKSNSASSMPTKITEPIAICGIGLRLTGGINSTDGLWDFLAIKEDARTPILSNRFSIDGFYSEIKNGLSKNYYGSSGYGIHTRGGREHMPHRAFFVTDRQTFEHRLSQKRTVHQQHRV